MTKASTCSIASSFQLVVMLVHGRGVWQDFPNHRPAYRGNHRRGCRSRQRRRKFGRQCGQESFRDGTVAKDERAGTWQNSFPPGRPDGGAQGGVGSLGDSGQWEAPLLVSKLGRAFGHRPLPVRKEGGKGGKWGGTDKQRSGPGAQEGSHKPSDHLAHQRARAMLLLPLPFRAFWAHNPQVLRRLGRQNPRADHPRGRPVLRLHPPRARRGRGTDCESGRGKGSGTMGGRGGGQWRQATRSREPSSLSS